MHRVTKETTWHPSKMKDVTYHPACTKPDKHSDADFARLEASIGEMGIQKPVLVQQSSGNVVAGRHRIKVAMKLGVPIPVQFLDITDSECWALSRSELAGRNLPPQRAAALYLEMKEEEEKAARAEQKANAKDEEPADPDEGSADDSKKEKKAPKRAKKGEGKKSKKEAKEAGVSPATLERVKKVKAKGISALWKAVDSGDVSAVDGAWLCDFDQDVQKKCLNMLKNGEVKTLKAAKAALDKAEADAAGPKLLDAKKNEVPSKLRTVFEDRSKFATLKENILDCRKQYAELTKRSSGKNLPKDLAKQLEDVALALDLYQPYVVADESEDGWITKHAASK